MAKLNTNRFTVVLTDIQTHNLALLLLEVGISKGALVQEGVNMVLKKYGYPVDKRAPFTVTKT